METMESDSRDGVQVELRQGNPALEFEERADALEQQIATATEEIARQAFDAAQGDRVAVEQVKKLRAEIDGAKVDLEVLNMAGTEAQRRERAEALRRSDAERAARKAEAREHAAKALAAAKECQTAIETLGVSRSALAEALKACKMAMHGAGERSPLLIGSDPQDAYRLASYELRRIEEKFLAPRPIDRMVANALASLLEADDDK